MTSIARAMTAMGLACLLTACQSTTDGQDTTPAAVAPLASVAAAQPPATATITETAPAQTATASATSTPAPTPATAADRTASANDAILAGVEAIARKRKAEGHSAALASVLDCYKRAQAQSVSLDVARICAAQDFVISRAIEDENGGPGRSSPALLVAGRAPERIGALMQLKGMSQPAFNTFGRYLHAVALPAFEKASA